VIKFWLKKSLHRQHLQSILIDKVLFYKTTGSNLVNWCKIPINLAIHCYLTFSQAAIGVIWDLLNYT